ncbi:hypothetical protein [Paenibacillus sp. KR2-11]|uniref:hypothetical protein n=1 Tax=Paenibacillus sp. KR2-11 TaxID=3385500 RepID=UPI0038FCC98B
MSLKFYPSDRDAVTGDYVQHSKTGYIYDVHYADEWGNAFIEKRVDEETGDIIEETFLTPGLYWVLEKAKEEKRLA